jgi:aspartyl-tRNA(Asn)/glutamyl-tRNA(Gln) amidotransferase subunit C
VRVDEKDVLYVADLANLELTPEERQSIVRDLSSILDYISRLNELDTSNVPAMAQIATQQGERSDLTQREDLLRPCLSHGEAMKNAPVTDGQFFKVPKVIER